MEEFETETEAFRWVFSEIPFSFIQDARFAFVDDKKAMKEYKFLRDSSSHEEQFDADIIVDGRAAKIGVSSCP